MKIARMIVLGAALLGSLCGAQAGAATNLPYDTPTAGTITSVAQTNAYTLQANAGDVLNFTIVATSGSLGPCLSLYDPSNNVVGTAGGDGYQDIEMNGVAISVTGTYTLHVNDCANTGMGPYMLFVQKTNAPVNPATLSLGVVTSGTIAQVAQSNAYTLTVNANDVFNFTLVASSASTLGPCIDVYNSSGTLVGAAGGDGYQDIELNLLKLTTPGTYNILIKDCGDTGTGGYDLFGQKTNNPVKTIPIVYGETQTGSINSIALTNVYTLNGTEGDALTFTVVAKSGSTLGPCIAIYNTTGTTTLASAGGDGYQDIVLSNYKIPATGTYNVFVKDCGDTGTGTYTLGTECLGACLLPVPQLNSISPTSALVGSNALTLTANGEGFAHVNAQSVVQWGGSNLTTAFGSTSQLTAQVPQSDLDTPGCVDITVYTPAPGGGTSSPPLSFCVDNPLPVLTSISPSSATVGGGPFTLTLNGSGFVSGSTAYWGAVALTTAYVSGTELTASVPAGDCATAGTATVTVVNAMPGGGTSAPQTFTCDNPAPKLTSITPSTVTAGGSGTTLTATGTGFVSTSSVQWNGTGLPTTYVSATNLTASIPAADTACGIAEPITVSNPIPGGGTSNSLTFTADNPTPAVTSISPSSAAEGGPSFTLTVTGSGFVTCSVVEWNGSGLATTFVSATSLTATVPMTDLSAEGTANVTVVNAAPGGGLSSPAEPFTIGPNPVPVLTSISPTSAVAGGPAFTLTATGSSFVQSSIVKWKGVALSTTFVSSTQLTATVPATDIATAGTAGVTVYTAGPGGGTSASKTFTIDNPVPVLTAISPTSTPAQGPSFTLTATGSNLVAKSTVDWNGVALVTTYVSATELTASVPDANIETPGTASITVVNAAPGGGKSAPMTFTIENPLAATPVIMPAPGSYGSGQMISITDTTAGKTIYYTTNGTTPTTSSTEYKSPFLLQVSATIEAIAVAPGYTQSDVATAVYIIGGTPVVLNLPAYGITATAADLRALVSDQNLTAQVWFMYGTSSTALTTSTPTQTLPAAKTAQSIKAALTGLAANTTYYYEAVATTAGGMSTSAVLSFTTP